MPVSDGFETGEVRAPYSATTESGSPRASGVYVTPSPIHHAGPDARIEATRDRAGGHAPVAMQGGDGGGTLDPTAGPNRRSPVESPMTHRIEGTA